MHPLQLLHARLHAFRQGEWSELLAQARAAEPASNHFQVPDSPADERRWERCCRLACSGELRRAMQALHSMGVVRGDVADTVRRLRALFRDEASPIAPPTMAPPSADRLVLKEHFFTSALRSAGRGKAPGMSGWRYEHLRVVLQLDGGVTELLALAQLLVDASIPPGESH